jgi:CTP-dependent riboflavin kinase
MFSGSMDCIVLSGRIQKGRGAAERQLDWLERKFHEALGKPPFPGTLNLLLDIPVVFAGETGFSIGSRLFVPARIPNVGVVVVHRWRGCPLHVVEVIAAVSIREALGGGDGEVVSLEVCRSDLVDPTWAQCLFHCLLWCGRRTWFYSNHWYSGLGVVRAIRHYFGQQVSTS